MSYKPRLVRKPLKPKSAANDAFYANLAATGRPDWKKAPKEIKIRAFGVYGVFLALPILIVTLYEMMRRLEGKSTKKVQQGEILDDKLTRFFGEQEKQKVEEDSILYKLFGKDFFQEGSTSRTMKNRKEESESK